jgi:hypothetical protein
MSTSSSSTVIATFEKAILLDAPDGRSNVKGCVRLTAGRIDFLEPAVDDAPVPAATVATWSLPHLDLESDLTVDSSGEQKPMPDLLSVSRLMGTTLIEIGSPGKLMKITVPEPRDTVCEGLLQAGLSPDILNLSKVVIHLHVWKRSALLLFILGLLPTPGVPLYKDIHCLVFLLVGGSSLLSRPFPWMMILYAVALLTSAVTLFTQAKGVTFWGGVNVWFAYGYFNMWREVAQLDSDSAQWRWVLRWLGTTPATPAAKPGWFTRFSGLILASAFLLFTAVFVGGNLETLGTEPLAAAEIGLLGLLGFWYAGVGLAPGVLSARMPARFTATPFASLILYPMWFCMFVAMVFNQYLPSYPAGGMSQLKGDLTSHQYPRQDRAIHYLGGEGVVPADDKQLVGNALAAIAKSRFSINVDREKMSMGDLLVEQALVKSMRKCGLNAHSPFEQRPQKSR